MDEFEQFRQTFFEECAELLEHLEEATSSLQPGQNDPDVLDRMFRAVHSIKAGAGAFKFERLVRFSHEFETVMDLVRSERILLDDDDPDFLLRCSDLLHSLVSAAQNGVEAAEGVEHEALEDLKDMAKRASDTPDMPLDMITPQADCDTSEKRFTIHFRPHRGLYESANEPYLLIDALAGLGALTVKADVSTIPDFKDFHPEEAYLAWDMDLLAVCNEADIREVFEFVEDECDLTITCIDGDVVELTDTPYVVEEKGADLTKSAPAPQAASPVKAIQTLEDPNAGQNKVSSIRVDLSRVDRLVDMVGELVIAQAVALQSLEELVDIRHVRQLQSLEDLTQRTRALQEGVMAIRMQPLRAVFSRFPRVVRDIAGKLGKRVRLEIEGEGTEVDKTIIEELSDPLTHMIRNCLDHGLETPEERKAAGKSEEGVVRLTAEQRNGRILIRVGDDGRGLNPEKVLKKAQEKGLVSQDADLSKEEIENLIFLPGFSTADQVSDLSGRGVGMDVVRRNIQKLGGRIGVDSIPGQGSTFTMALPLTLAVLDGMLVSARGETYVIPLSAIVETVCPKASDLRDMPDSGQVMSLRGEVIRLIDVGTALQTDTEDNVEPLRQMVVVTETELGRKIGLIVDGVLGQQQVVIKSLEVNYRAIAGVAGTAVLGDGRVRLILDVDGLSEINPTSQDAPNALKQKGMRA